MPSTPYHRDPAQRVPVSGAEQVFSTAQWSVIIPVKQTTRGKTRLTGVSAEARRQLALAFALDTTTAAVSTSGVRRVLVVTNDPDSDAFAELGAQVVPDHPDAGLNTAILHGARRAIADDPMGGLVALAGDLPALTSDVLGDALAQAPSTRWFVPDTAGEGTTMLVASGEPLSPLFGPGSRVLHESSGAVPLDAVSLGRLRRDVDTEVDLWDAVRMGVGKHTREVLSRQGYDS